MLKDTINSFSQARADTLLLLQRLSQQQLDYKAGSGKWSLGEVMDHLYLAERFFRTQIGILVERQRSDQSRSLALSFSDLNVRPAFLPGFLLPFVEIPLRMTNVFVPRPLRQLLLTTPLVRARHPDAADPRPNLAKEQLQTQLSQGVAETLAVFEQNPHLDFSSLRISHPLLGDNSVIELLDIMTIHERGHQQKIRESIGRLPSELSTVGPPSA